MYRNTIDFIPTSISKRYTHCLSLIKVLRTSLYRLFVLRYVLVLLFFGAERALSKPIKLSFFYRCLIILNIFDELTSNMFAPKPSDWLIFTIRYKYIYPHRKRIYWQFPFDKMECTVQLLFEMQFVSFFSLKIHSKRNTINCYRRRYQFSAIIAIAWMYVLSYCNKWNKISFELIKLRLDCKRKFTKK